MQRIEILPEPAVPGRHRAPGRQGPGVGAAGGRQGRPRVPAVQRAVSHGPAARHAAWPGGGAWHPGAVARSMHGTIPCPAHSAERRSMQRARQGYAPARLASPRPWAPAPSQVMARDQGQVQVGGVLPLLACKRARAPGQRRDPQSGSRDMWDIGMSPMPDPCPIACQRPGLTGGRAP